MKVCLPFERIYNTLGVPKKITVIPIIKDEGSKGDRDFIQWDTVALMSLLDVYVILAYYNQAEAHKTRVNKITNQRFDNDYVIAKVREIGNYHSSALHWNLKEIEETMPKLIIEVIKSYAEIGAKLGVGFHSSKGLLLFQEQFRSNVSDFMKTSRAKAMAAQNREHLTTQPKEHLATITKAKITITNYLGGHYYFTTDELIIKDNFLYLIEGKHSLHSKLPSIGDIKDGLLKMVLYSNLSTITIEGETFKAIPVLKLTSTSIRGRLTKADSQVFRDSFINTNGFNENRKNTIRNLFDEAGYNNFEVIIEGV